MHWLAYFQEPKAFLPCITPHATEGMPRQDPVQGSTQPADVEKECPNLAAFCQKATTSGGLRNE